MPDDLIHSKYSVGGTSMQVQIDAPNVIYFFYYHNRVLSIDENAQSSKSSMKFFTGAQHAI
jgi:hypothetical protein